MKSGLPKAERLLVVLLAGLVLARLATMAILPLMDTTEARYAEIARKMAALGDWVTPWADDDVPFWGKPPFSFWITALSFRLLGVSEFAARLPHLLCAVLVGLLVWDISRRVEGRRVAIIAVSLLAGSTLFLVSAAAVMTDMALVLGTAAELYGFWGGLFGTSERHRRLSAWIFFLGLAVGLLAKGPVALVLSGVPIGLWVLIENRWKETFTRLPWIPGALLVAVLVLPWYWLAEEKTPGFLEYFIVGEHWKRFVEPGWTGDLYGRAHNFPIGTIWLFALIAALPWPFTVLIVTWEARGRKPLPRERSWARYTLLWALAPLLFFTASRNIIWTYALPCLPGASLFMAGWFAARSERIEQWVASGLAIMIALTIGAGTGAAFFPQLLDDVTARAVAVAYLSRRQADEPLYFVKHRPFSATFYSQNAARVLREDELATALSEKSGYLAVPAGLPLPKLPPDLEADETPGNHGKYRLLHVRRKPAD